MGVFGSRKSEDSSARIDGRIRIRDTDRAASDAVAGGTGGLGREIVLAGVKHDGAADDRGFAGERDYGVHTIVRSSLGARRYISEVPDVPFLTVGCTVRHIQRIIVTPGRGQIVRRAVTVLVNVEPVLTFGEPGDVGLYPDAVGFLRKEDCTADILTGCRMNDGDRRVEIGKQGGLLHLPGIGCLTTRFLLLPPTADQCDAENNREHPSCVRIPYHRFLHRVMHTCNGISVV